MVKLKYMLAFNVFLSSISMPSCPAPRPHAPSARLRPPPERCLVTCPRSPPLLPPSSPLPPSLGSVGDQRYFERLILASSKSRAHSDQPRHGTSRKRTGIVLVCPGDQGRCRRRSEEEKAVVTHTASARLETDPPTADSCQGKERKGTALCKESSISPFFPPQLLKTSRVLATS